MKQLPAQFIEEIRQSRELSVLERTLCTEPEVSIRLNPAKTGLVYGDAVPWCPEGRYLGMREQFTFDPALHQGRYYVQDASSMAITAAIRAIAGDAPLCYLDACAAPGGKTTAAISALPKGSLVVANEFDYKRAPILAENVAKWGIGDVIVTRGDTAAFKKLRDTFDIIAVDAPCSGEGMMRKDDDAVAQWSPALVDKCAALQREILGNVWQALKPGGRLIYSTCTFNTVENEGNLAWMVDTLGAQPMAIPELDTCNGIVKALQGPYPCYRFIPGHIRGEGLFICAVTKPGESIATHRGAKKKNDKHAKSKTPDTAQLKKWLNDDYELSVIGDDVYALSREHAATARVIADNTDVISYGTHIATIKGRDFIPAQQLALSDKLNTGAFSRCEVEYRDAINYLRRESVTLGGDVPKGFVLLTYGGYPLGFVKNLGNRTNNLYPKTWKINSTHIPEHPPKIL